MDGRLHCAVRGRKVRANRVHLVTLVVRQGSVGRLRHSIETTDIGTELNVQVERVR